MNRIVPINRKVNKRQTLVFCAIYALARFALAARHHVTFVPTLNPFLEPKICGFVPNHFGKS